MFQWDDIRFFLALARSGSTSGAANRLKVNQSTVSRRLSLLEDALQRPLFERGRHGLMLLPEGERLMEHALIMESQAHFIERAFRDQDVSMTGTVKLTTVEEIAEGWLVPNLPRFRERWPKLIIDLIATHKTLDLTRGQADVALRMFRPKERGVLARKVGGFTYTIFASQAYLDGLRPEQREDLASLDWMVMDAGDFNLPCVNWFKKHLGHVTPILRCTSQKALLAAVRAGMGVAILPRPYRHHYDDLVALPIDTREVRCEIWMVIAERNRNNKAVQEVAAFILESLNVVS